METSDLCIICPVCREGIQRLTPEDGSYRCLPCQHRVHVPLAETDGLVALGGWRSVSDTLGLTKQLLHELVAAMLNGHKLQLSPDEDAVYPSVNEVSDLIDRLEGLRWAMYSNYVAKSPAE